MYTRLSPSISRNPDPCMYLSEGGDATLLKNDVSQNWNSFQLAVHLLTLFVRLGSDIS